MDTDSKKAELLELIQSWCVSNDFPGNNQSLRVELIIEPQISVIMKSNLDELMAIPIGTFIAGKESLLSEAEKIRAYGFCQQYGIVFVGLLARQEKITVSKLCSKRIANKLASMLQKCGLDFYLTNMPIGSAEMAALGSVVVTTCGDSELMGKIKDRFDTLGALAKATRNELAAAYELDGPKLNISFEEYLVRIGKTLRRYRLHGSFD